MSGSKKPLSLKGIVSKSKKKETTEQISLMNIEKETKIAKSIDGVDDLEMEMEGIVSYSCDSNGAIFFKLRTESFKDCEILCRYHHSIPIRKYDRAMVSGIFGYEIFDGRNQQCFICDEVSAFYYFDLNNFLISQFPDIGDQSKLHSLAERIVQYSEEMYHPEEGIFAVIECFDDLSKNLDKDNGDIDNFCEAVYGDPDKYRTKVRKFLMGYVNEALKRPLQLLGITDKEIESISHDMSLSKAYKIVRENPYRIPVIKLDIAERICKNILRMEKIPIDWIDCGIINREVYNRLKVNHWTSVPLSKMERMFPSSFTRLRETLYNEYFCSEDFGSVYYEPWRKKEENIAKFIAGLIKGKKNDALIPIYPGFIPSEEQDHAIQRALIERISIITGGAGTGKTQIEGELCRAIINAGYVPLCVAYTGSAVQQIKESLEDAHVYDQCKVMTIHMACIQSILLQGLNIKYIIFDEASMIDGSLFAWFINCFSFVSDITIIIVGDCKQLAPMSYCNVMEQLMKTSIPIFHLTTNYRSEKGILNITNLIVDEERHQKQEIIDWTSHITDDFQYITGNQDVLNSYIAFLYEEFFENCEKEEDEEVMEDLIKYRDEITVISPYKRIVQDTNLVFQSIFMENFDHVVIDGKKYHLYDRVMKLKNNYTISVMNGEVGIITEIRQDYVVVRFRKTQPVYCPFFSRDGLRKVKTMKKLIDYSPFSTEEGRIENKSMELITEELQDLREKFLRMNLLDKGVSPDTINEFFDIGIMYPYAVFGLKEEKTEFLSLNVIDLAYAQTTRKSQGKGFIHTIFVVFEPYTSFVTRGQVYVGKSRAKKRLTTISESESLINSCVLTPDRYVYDNLAVRINSKLPPELKVEIEEPEYYDDNDIIDDGVDFNCIDFGIDDDMY